MSRCRIAHFQLLGKLGEGRLGTVYAAYDECLQRQVAIKQIYPHLAEDPEIVSLFVNELRMAASINDPRVTRIYSCGEESGIPYLAMELVRGHSLHDIIRTNGFLPEQEAISVATQSAKGLHAAYQLGLVHSSLKPANLVLNAQKEVKILDFGISGVLNKVTQQESKQNLPYLPPEQLRGLQRDHRSDIYSLGATLFHTVTGQLPTKNEKTTQLILEGINDPYVLPERRAPKVNNRTTQIIRRMLHPNITQRYGNYLDIINDLYEAQEEVTIYPETASPAYITIPSPDEVQDHVQPAIPRRAPSTETRRIVLKKKKKSVKQIIPMVVVTLIMTGFFGYVFLPQNEPQKQKVAGTSVIPTYVPMSSRGVHSIPGEFQVEDFDDGGSGVSYFDDTTINDGEIYREHTGVDLKVQRTMVERAIYLTNTSPGEWLAYTVNVQEQGKYDFEFRVANKELGGRFHLEVDGVDVTGQLDVPGTGDWWNWVTVFRKGVELTQGRHLLKLVMDSSDGIVGNFDLIRVSRAKD